jgi:hypothetical protein
VNLLPILQFQLCLNDIFHDRHQRYFLSFQSKDVAFFFSLSKNSLLCSFDSLTNIPVREAIVQALIVVLNQQDEMKCDKWRYHIPNEEEDFHQKKW